MKENNKKSLKSNSDSEHEIVVVDDDSVSAYLIKEIISTNYYRIVLKKDGQEASDYINSHHEKIDMVIMDVILPRKDGIKTTEFIRKNKWKMPIIAVSADPDENNQKKCLEAGCNTFLAKPLNVERFLHIINEYLSVKA